MRKQQKKGEKAIRRDKSILEKVIRKRRKQPKEEQAIRRKINQFKKRRKATGKMEEGFRKGESNRKWENKHLGEREINFGEVIRNGERIQKR